MDEAFDKFELFKQRFEEDCRVQAQDFDNLFKMMQQQMTANNDLILRKTTEFQALMQ